MIGLWVANLIIPGAPDKMTLNAPQGGWELHKAHDYSVAAAAIAAGKSANTYALENPVSMRAGGAAACDAATDELTPLLLGASFLTGRAVTSIASTMASEMQIVQPSSHWPRDRAMDTAAPVVSTETEFSDRLSKFVASWPGAGQQEKALLLVHHWLDALSCWSLEDLYLSSSTLLQIIVATEEALTGKSHSYFDGATAAAGRVGISPLSRDFKDKRNNLIHEGHLLGPKFAGRSKDDCAQVAADLLNWFDEYLHAALALGTVVRQRFSKSDFLTLNAYSLP
ncbi:MAG: hypothetical protein ISS15_21070 [Alphaproteobacteria bacterium]|nr:hypothetical protein [Reyranella sp.]MBL6940071.1 hypothetical protein [Alphaproteobacteria bacterium]MBL7100158.1 hypothetical protein [Alphaproteobacteria bacterium]